MSNSDVKPFSPDEARAVNRERVNAGIPGFVLEIVNNILSERMHANVSEVKIQVNDVVAAIEEQCAGMVGFQRQQIFNNHWLDFEDVYRKQGWGVEFYKMPYYEESSDFYMFKAAK